MASYLASTASNVANWDPLGLAEAMEPAGATSEARDELADLKRAVRTFLTSSSGLPASARLRGVGGESAALASALGDAADELDEERESARRELTALRNTVSLLQDERRKDGAANGGGAVPEARRAPRASPSPPRRPEAAPSAALTDAFAQGRAEAMAECRAHAAAAAAAARSDGEAAAARAGVLARKEEQEASARERAASVRRHARALEARLDAESRAALDALAVTISELEIALVAAHDTRLQAVTITKQRAAQVLLAPSPLPCTAGLAARLVIYRAGLPPGRTPRNASTDTLPVLFQMLAAKDDEIGRLRSERSGREIRRDIAEPPQTADAAVGPDESMNSPRNSPINSPGAASGSGPASAADTAALLAAAGGEEGGYGALASRFARRVSELESQVAAARAQCSAAREESTETARQERALRGRVAHLTRALERSRGGGEYDAEYVHNVMLN